MFIILIHEDAGVVALMQVHWSVFMQELRICNRFLPRVTKCICSILSSWERNVLVHVFTFPHVSFADDL